MGPEPEDACPTSYIGGTLAQPYYFMGLTSDQCQCNDNLKNLLSALESTYQDLSGLIKKLRWDATHLPNHASFGELFSILSIFVICYLDGNDVIKISC